MEELVNSYLKIGMTIEPAKRCVLLAIDEIEKEGLLLVRYELEEDRLSKMHIEHCRNLRNYVRRL
jgi:hypothetical protein